MSHVERLIMGTYRPLAASHLHWSKVRSPSSRSSATLKVKRGQRSKLNGLDGLT